MDSHITATTPEQLIEDATEAARRFLRSAVSAVDDLKESREVTNPELLIAAFMRSASLDYAATTMSQQLRAGIDDLAETLGNQLDGIAENVRSDHPLMAESFSGISSSLQSIAEMLDLYSCGRPIKEKQP